MRRIFGMLLNSSTAWSHDMTEHIGDGFAVEADFEHVGVVAQAAARFAFDPHVGQEVHLDANLAVAFARFAAAARHVEAEPASRVAAELRFGQLREQRANQVEDAGVRGRVRRRRVAERLLIDADHLVDLLDAADRFVRAGDGVRTVQCFGELVVEDVFDERTLAAAANAGDGGEGAERDLHVDVFEIVVASADDFEGCRSAARADFFGNRRSPFCRSGTGPVTLPRCPGDFVGRAGGYDLAAEPAGAGAEVEQAVGAGDHFAVVLDDEKRVAEVAKFLQCDDEAGVVARVEADRRLVEHVQHAAQAAADLAGEANALGFAAGERWGGAAECEVVETDVDEEREPVLDFANQLAGDFLFVGRRVSIF